MIPIKETLPNKSGFGKAYDRMSLQNWRTDEMFKKVWCIFQLAKVDLQEYGANDWSSQFINLKWLRNCQGNWVLHMEMEIKQAGWFYIQKHNLQSSNCVKTERFSASILAPKFFLAGFGEEHIFWSLANHKQAHLFWKQIVSTHCAFRVWRFDRWKMWAWGSKNGLQLQEIKSDRTNIFME